MAPVQPFRTLLHVCRWSVVGGTLKLLVLSGFLVSPILASAQPPHEAHAHYRWEQVVPVALDARIWKNTTGHLTRQHTPENLVRLLNTIVIPELDFEQTTFGDAVESIREQSYRVGAQTPRNSKVPGISLFIKYPTSDPVSDTTSPGTEPTVPVLSDATALPAPSPRPESQEPRVTLKLRNVPILEAYAQIARAAGMKTKLTPFILMIIPARGDDEELATAEFDVSPDFPLRQLADNSGSPEFLDARPFMEAAGMEFPSMANAIYVHPRHMLVIRNTEKNLEKVTTPLPRRRAAQVAGRRGATKNQSPRRK